MERLLILFAQKIPTGDIPALDPAKVVVAGLNIFYFATGATAVIVIILAGFTYVTAHGDSNLIAKAKNAILYSVIGIVVISSAFVVTNFLTKGSL